MQCSFEVTGYKLNTEKENSARVINLMPSNTEPEIGCLGGWSREHTVYMEIRDKRRNT